MSDKISEVKESAQRFASKGFMVFPRYGQINPKNWNGKKVVDGAPVEGWHGKSGGSGKEFSMPATTNVNKIAEWPDELYSNPLSSYGINPRRRSVIIDVDNYDKKQELQTNIGSQSLELLAEKYNIDVSSAFKVNSKSPGCFHLYFAYPSEIADSEWVRSSTSPKIDGIKYDSIDIRSDRAFVVGPTPSGPYKLASKFEDLGDLPSLPPQLIEFLTVKENLNDIAPDDDELVPPGGRDDHMFRLMCKLKGIGLSKSKAAAVIKEEFTRLEQPQGDEITIDHFLTRLSDMYDDTSYSANPYQVKLSEYFENLVLVASPHGVFDQRTKLFMKLDAARSTYRHTITIESEDANGEIKTKKVDIFEVWIKHNDRQQAQGIGYKPNAPTIYMSALAGRDVKLVNKYIAPILSFSDISKSRNIEMWRFLIDYIWEQDAEYAEKWCASIVQQPHLKIQHMLMLISPVHGVGKDVFFKSISKVLGAHNTSVIQLENLEEKYNSYMQESTLVMINESNKVAESKAASVNSKFKFMVTAERVPIRRMGTDIEMHETFSNFLMCGNSTSIMRIDEEDNRIFPHICSRREELPEDFAIEYYAAIETPEFANDLFTHLKSVSLAGFNYYGRAPESSDKAKLVRDNRPAVQSKIHDWIDEGSGIFSVDLITKQSFEFAINEEFGHGFVRQGAAGFLRNLWLDTLRSIRLVKEVRYQPMAMRSGPQNALLVRPSVASKVYSIRNHDMYTSDMDSSIIIKRLFEGLENVDSLCPRAMGLTARTKKIIGQ